MDDFGYIIGVIGAVVILILLSWAYDAWKYRGVEFREPTDEDFRIGEEIGRQLDAFEERHLNDARLVYGAVLIFGLGAWLYAGYLYVEAVNSTSGGPKLNAMRDAFILSDVPELHAPLFVLAALFTAMALKFFVRSERAVAAVSGASSFVGSTPRRVIGEIGEELIDTHILGRIRRAEDVDLYGHLRARNARMRNVCLAVGLILLAAAASVWYLNSRHTNTLSVTGITTSGRYLRPSPKRLVPMEAITGYRLEPAGYALDVVIYNDQGEVTRYRVRCNDLHMAAIIDGNLQRADIPRLASYEATGRLTRDRWEQTLEAFPPRMWPVVFELMGIMPQAPLGTESEILEWLDGVDLTGPVRQDLEVPVPAL